MQFFTTNYYRLQQLSISRSLFSKIDCAIFLFSVQHLIIPYLPEPVDGLKVSRGRHGAVQGDVVPLSGIHSWF